MRKKFKEFITEKFGSTFRLLPFVTRKPDSGDRILTKQDLEIVIIKKDWKKMLKVLDKGGSYKFKEKLGKNIRIERSEIKGIHELIIFVDGSDAGLLHLSGIKYLL